jgi:arylsulfatase A-like enzyme
MKMLSKMAPVRAVFQALLVAAGTAFFGEIAFSLALARGVTPPLAYLLLCGGLTLVAVLVCGAIVSFALPRVSFALATWAGLNALLCLRGLTDNTALVALGMALLTIVIASRRRSASAGVAMGVGVAFVLIAVFRYRALMMFGIDDPGGSWFDIAIIGGYGSVLILFWSYSRAREKLRWLPPEAFACGLLILLLAVGVYFSKAAVRTRVTGTSAPQTEGDRRDHRDRPSVLVLVLDTVRADHLSVYGYARDTTPKLKRFIEQHERSRLYPLAFSPGCWTLPGHASLFTGELPSTHGGHFDHTGSPIHSLRHATFKAEHTLAEVMRRRGYRTAAIFANALLSMCPGLERGFDLFEKPQEPQKLFLTGDHLRKIFLPDWFADQLLPYPLGSVINRGVLQFIDNAAGDPFFIVANYMEAHDPYVARRPYRGMFSRDSELPTLFDCTATDPRDKISAAADRYDEELRSLDAHLDQLFDELEKRGILATSWLVITSDHGEAFLEHGVVNHASSVYNEEVRVPLVIHPPAGVRLPPMPDAVSLVDVATTLAAVAGFEPFGIGRDLRSSPIPIEPVQIQFFGTDDEKAREWGDLAAVPARAVVLGRDKLIEYPSARELYRLEDDPDELRDLSSCLPAEAVGLAGLLSPLAIGERATVESREELSFEQRERLKALGYVD